MTKEKAIEIAKELYRMLDRIQSLSFMTHDNCDADRAYKKVESAIDWLLQATGMNFDDQEKVMLDMEQE